MKKLLILLLISVNSAGRLKKNRLSGIAKNLKIAGLLPSPKEISRMTNPQDHSSKVQSANKLLKQQKQAHEFPEKEFLFSGPLSEKEYLSDEAAWGPLAKMYTVIHDQKKGARLFCLYKKGFKDEKFIQENDFEMVVLSGKIFLTDHNTGITHHLGAGEYSYTPGGIPRSWGCTEDAKVFFVMHGEMKRKAWTG